jgi:hypothetical protein
MGLSAIDPGFLVRAMGVQDVWAGVVFMISVNLLVLIYAAGEAEEAGLSLLIHVGYRYLLVLLAASTVLLFPLILLPIVGVLAGVAAFASSFVGFVWFTGFGTKLRSVSKRDWLFMTWIFAATMLVLALSSLLTVAIGFVALLGVIGWALLAHYVSVSAEKTGYRIAFMGGSIAGLLLFLSILWLT